MIIEHQNQDDTFFAFNTKDLSFISIKNDDVFCVTKSNFQFSLMGREMYAKILEEMKHDCSRGL